jgi:prophage regulatory protein
MPDELKLLTFTEVMQRTGMKRTALYARMNADNFPRGVPVGERAKRWPEHEVSAWIAARIAARDAVPVSGPKPRRHV